MVDEQIILKYLRLNKGCDCDELMKTFSLTIYRLVELLDNLIIIEVGQKLSLLGGDDEILIYEVYQDNNTWNQYYYEYQTERGYRKDNLQKFHKLLFDENLSIRMEVDYSIESYEVEINLINPILLFYEI